jgi:Tol biopolymer transport system component
MHLGPVWSPDGCEIVFSSNRESVYNLYRKPANGAREETLLLRSNLHKRAMSWSRDGKFLLYATSESVNFNDEDLWVLPMQGHQTPYPFQQTRFDESNARFSTDGRWVAYDTNETVLLTGRRCWGSSIAGWTWRVKRLPEALHDIHTW